MNAIVPALLGFGLATGAPPDADVPTLTNHITPAQMFPTETFITNGYIIKRRHIALSGTNATAAVWNALVPNQVEVLYGDADMQPGKLVAVRDGLIVARRVLFDGGRAQAQTFQFYGMATINHTNYLDVFESFRPGTFGEHIWTNALAAVGQFTNDFNMRRTLPALPWCYSNMIPWTNGWLWRMCTNANFWAAGKSNPLWTTTCGNVWYQGAAKMITRRHWVTTGHMQPPVGEKHYFIGPQGQTATRTTIAVTNGLYSGVADLAVCLLDEDTPEWVTPACMFDFNPLVEITKGALQIFINQARWASFVEAPLYFPCFGVSILQPGDSGSAIGLVLDKRFILTGYGALDTKLIARWITNLNAENNIPQTYSLNLVTSNELASRFIP